VFEFVNRLSSAVFETLIWLGQDLPLMLQTSVLAFFAAIFALLVFRLTSNQPEIVAAKDKIKAHFLELRLFNDNLTVTLAAQAKIVIYTLKYLRHTLLPAILLLVPFTLLVIQIESTYAWRSLEIGESTILTIKLNGSRGIDKLSPRLSAPAGLLLETPALRIDETNQILWRIRALAPGVHTVNVDLGGAGFERGIAVGIRGLQFTPTVYSRNDVRTLTSPGTVPLPGDGVSSITVSYPRSSKDFAGLSSVSWCFFIVSLAIAYALRGLFSVTF